MIKTGHVYNVGMSAFPNPFRSEVTPGTLFVISGTGGSGKSTIANELVSRHDNLWRSISMTTRNPRPGEVPSFDYYFVSEADFKAKFRNDEFLEYASVYNSWYGTPRAPVEAKLAEGVHVLLVIDTQGGLTVRQNHQDAVLIFIQPPDKETLRQRMQQRNKDSKLAIETRLNAADEEMDIGSNQYDYVVVNDDLEKAISQVADIILQH